MALAHAPAVLKGHLALSGALGGGVLAAPVESCSPSRPPSSMVASTSFGAQMPEIGAMVRWAMIRITSKRLTRR